MRSALLVSALACLGCSAVINPDQGRLGDPIDAGATAVPDGGRADTGIVLRIDSGPPDRPDTGPLPDTGPPVECSFTEPRCEGDTRVRCEGGVEARTDCRRMGSYCAVGACMAWVCMPGARGCSPDGSAAVACTARGDRLERTECVDGSCDPATGACEGPPPVDCSALDSIELRSPVTIDLCDFDDATTTQPGEGCPASTRADSGDRTYRLEIREAGRYRITLRDVDGGRDIDTVVSIRRACDDRGTQIACGDDDDCFDILPGDSCMDGVQLGRSEITVNLEPGTYYVVADAYLYERDGNEYRCGEVRLEVDRPFSVGG